MENLLVISMNQLSLVLARYPFTNQIDYKIRPTLIISNEKFNNNHNYFLVCPVTSKESLKEFEIEIPKKDYSSELKTRSFIRTDSIASIEKELFIKEIGKISSALFQRVKRRILENL